MKKTWIYLILLLLIVGGLVIYIILRNKAKSEPTTDDKKIEQTDENKKEEEKIEKKEESKTESNTDFSTYSSNRQIVGGETEALFTLEKITDSAKDGYHQFVFQLKGTDTPYVTSHYNSSSGVIKVELFNIEKDNSGIAYQTSRDINKEGITRLYRNVSGAENKSLYDIGLTQSTVFKLSEDKVSDEIWQVTLNIKYPGQTTVTESQGSTEFSENDQSITGVGADKNASAVSYQYSTSGGVLKFVWGVSADGDNPTPSVNAKYDTNGDLIVVFESLSLDRVGGTSKSIPLPLGITLNTSRSGETTTYTFTGLGEKSPYRLSSSLSPNQIIVEIK